ncbi:MAG: DUF1214 domain-containing protein [Xanthobacteraceae bacterium]
MRLLFGFLVAFAVAAAVGLGATWLALTKGTAFGPLRIGAWTAWPKTGTAEIDPYARAIIARTGELPVASGDGIAFYATTTDLGELLDGRCEIVLAGTTPTARFWTLTLYDPEGRLIANAINRYGFTSEEVIRSMDGGFTIVIAPRARSGNWLPTSGVERYILELRLYDTPVGVATRAGRDAQMPSVTRKACPP